MIGTGLARLPHKLAPLGLEPERVWGAVAPEGER